MAFDQSMASARVVVMLLWVVKGVPVWTRSVSLVRIHASSYKSVFVSWRVTVPAA
jgi:hypothetical protein